MTHVLSETGFQHQLESMKKAADIEIEKPKAVVEEVTKRYQFSEQEGENILNNFFNEKRTVWGLANSITALAHNVENPDRQYEYEKIGNDIVQHATSWKDIA